MLNLSACIKSGIKRAENRYFSREQYGYMVANRSNLYHQSHLGYSSTRLYDPAKWERKLHSRYRDEYSRSFFMKNE